MSNTLSVTVCAQSVLRRWCSLCEKSRETHETRCGQSSRAKAPSPPPATTTSKVTRMNARIYAQLESKFTPARTLRPLPSPRTPRIASHDPTRVIRQHIPRTRAHATRDARAMRHRPVAFRAVSRLPRRRQCAPSARRASRIRAIRASKRSKRVVPEFDARARAHEHRAWRRVTWVNAMPRIVVRQGASGYSAFDSRSIRAYASTTAIVCVKKDNDRMVYITWV
jgi:hypothetical protein